MNGNGISHKQIGTKIDSDMAEILNAVCDSLQVNVSNLLQWFCYTILRAAAPIHQLDPRIQRLLNMTKNDNGWQNAFNIANRNNLPIAQCILILEQDTRHGQGAVMVDKPFMTEARQTECVDDILERVAEVTMPGVYRRLRMMGARMGCQNLMDVLLTMLERQATINHEEEDGALYPQMGDRADNGCSKAYGKRSKARQWQSSDSIGASTDN